MNFSYATIQSLFGIGDTSAQPQQPQPGSFLQEILQYVANKAKGPKTNIGPTHPLHGEIAYLKQTDTKRTQAVQFPTTELLDDGRHRFFLQNGALVDRLQ